MGLKELKQTIVTNAVLENAPLELVILLKDAVELYELDAFEASTVRERMIKVLLSTKASTFVINYQEAENKVAGTHTGRVYRDGKPAKTGVLYTKKARSVSKADRLEITAAFRELHLLPKEIAEVTGWNVGTVNSVLNEEFPEFGEDRAPGKWTRALAKIKEIPYGRAINGASIGRIKP